MSKLAAARAQREAKAAKLAKFTMARKPSTLARGKPKAAAAPKAGKSADPTPFDRTAYQRIYCRMRRIHGKLADWPQDALDALRAVSKGRVRLTADPAP